MVNGQIVDGIFVNSTLQLPSALLTLKSMPGRAKSAEKKAQICCEEEDLAMERAVAMYHAEQAKVAPEKKKSLRVVCREIESGSRRIPCLLVRLKAMNALYMKIKLVGSGPLLRMAGVLVPFRYYI